MQKCEVILQVGAEGGSYTLYGFRDGTEWRFSLDLVDHSLLSIGEGSLQSKTSGIFDSFDEAIKAFDAYPWHLLYPLAVHPEFRDIIRKELYGRTSVDADTLGFRKGDWEHLLNSDAKAVISDFFETDAAADKAGNEKESAQRLDTVYVLTNPVMPGLVKIGCATQYDAKIRIEQLFTVGVPVPFDIAFACSVGNAAEVLEALHTAFAPQRINPQREFFEIEPEQAIAILRLLHTEDTTREVESHPTTVDVESVLASQRVKARRPTMNFTEMGIPIGAALQSVRGDFTCTVFSGRTVLFEGEEMYLATATKMVLGVNYPIQPSPYWMWQGRKLKEIYDEIYNV